MKTLLIALALLTTTVALAPVPVASATDAACTDLTWDGCPSAVCVKDRQTSRYHCVPPVIVCVTEPCW